LSAAKVQKKPGQSWANPERFTPEEREAVEQFGRLRGIDDFEEAAQTGAGESIGYWFRRLIRWIPRFTLRKRRVH